MYGNLQEMELSSPLKFIFYINILFNIDCASLCHIPASQTFMVGLAVLKLLDEASVFNDGNIDGKQFSEQQTQ